MPEPLAGRVALVTGGSRGIGLACCLALARSGATVIINGRQAESVNASAEMVKTETGSEAHPLPFDVSDSTAVGRAYQEVFKKYGRLDILVNSAGILGDALIGMIDDQMIDQVLSTNIRGTINNLQAAVRLMKRARTGSVVNISSIVGRSGNPGQSVYSASKAAVIGLTLSAARELGPAGIRVNAIAPGVIETDMTKHLTPPQRDALLARVALGRPGTAADVADVVCFLASDGARYVSGQVIGIDGGMFL